MNDEFPSLIDIPNHIVVDILDKLKRRDIIASNNNTILRYYPQYSSWSLNDFNRYMHRYLLPPSFVVYGGKKPIATHLILDAEDEDIDLLPYIIMDDIILKISGSELIESWHTPLLKNEFNGSSNIERRKSLHRLVKPDIIRSVSKYKDLLSTLNKYHPNLVRSGTHILDVDIGYAEFAFSCLGFQDVIYTGYTKHRGIYDRLLSIKNIFTSGIEFNIYHDTFDLVGDIEKYDIAFYNPEIQTTKHFIFEFLAKYVIQTLTRVWTSIRTGGLLLMQLYDTRSINITSIVNLYIEQKLPYSSYLGVIGISNNKNNKCIPIWVWQKKDMDQSYYRWMSNSYIKSISEPNIQERNFDEIGYKIFNVNNSNY